MSGPLPRSAHAGVDYCTEHNTLLLSLGLTHRGTLPHGHAHAPGGLPHHGQPKISTQFLILGSDLVVV